MSDLTDVNDYADRAEAEASEMRGGTNAPARGVIYALLAVAEELSKLGKELGHKS